MMNPKNEIAPQVCEVIIFQTPDGQTRLDVQMQEETVWLTQQQMAILFEKDRTVIGRHINNIFKEGELERNEVCAKFAHTTQHGTQFRIWANRVLKEYLLNRRSPNSRASSSTARCSTHTSLYRG